MGHFYDTIRGIGKNRQDALHTAIDEFLYENGHRHSVCDYSEGTLVRKVPPHKEKRVTTGNHTLISYEPDPTAPQNEWLEMWEFELHTHA